MQRRILLILLCAAMAVQFVGCVFLPPELFVPSYTEGSVPSSDPSEESSQATEVSSEATEESTEPTEESTEPTEESTEPTEESTEPTEETTEPTEAPTEAPTQAPTEPEPTKDPNEMIGTLYTRGQLAALSSKRYSCSFGTTINNTRHSTSINLQNKYGKYDAHFIAPDNGKFYLTFTMGYEHLNLTGTILDILKEKDVKAVFFINRHYAKSQPALVRRIIDEGHILANHATNHPDMGTISIDSMVSEIMTVHQYVLDTYGYEMKYFRPPSGYYNEQLLAVAQSLGYTTVQYSFAYRDWDTANQLPEEEAMAKMTDAIHSGAIFYLHTVSTTNAAIMNQFIDIVREKGLEFALPDFA